MHSSDDPIIKLLAGYWDDQGLLLSRDLIEHERFLLTLMPTGDVDSDLDHFFRGIGQRELVDACRAVNGNLRMLATWVLRKHREELARIASGEGPGEAGKYQRWSKEQRAFYKHVVELEASVLDAILESGPARGVAS